MKEQRTHHPRNKHRGRYDFKRLLVKSPGLAAFVRKNPDGDSTIDFENPAAVKALNRAILQTDYGVKEWDIPDGYLCPAIPGRADYIHAVADLLAEQNKGVVPKGKTVRVLDVGTGANIVYPLIGISEYGWSFVGSDSDPAALKSASTILQTNPDATKLIELREQKNPKKIFEGVLKPDERFHLTLCNPPFHASLEEAMEGTQRKWRNLGKSPSSKSSAPLNFGGKKSEIITEGGERGFILRMIAESTKFREQVAWFTTLVSKQTNLPAIEKALIQAKVEDLELIEMAHGQKKSRIVAWRFAHAR